MPVPPADVGQDVCGGTEGLRGDSVLKVLDLLKLLKLIKFLKLPILLMVPRSRRLGGGGR